MLSVTHYYRESRKTGLSIEGIFGLVKECLRGNVVIKDFYCDINRSRIGNTLQAKKYASEINHITGDVNFLLFGLRGRKNILTIHDVGHCDTLKKRNYIHYLIYKYFWYQFPLLYTDIVTVVSEFTKRTIIEYFNCPEHKIRVIPDPVKPVFQYSKKGALNEQPRILMMGTGRHKNLGNLIEAVKGTGYHIDIIGWPSDEELGKLDTYKVSYKVFNGLTDREVYERYKECDIMYNASFYEGFGMPIIEAQSVGRPVITSNIGAMKEVAGTSAVLVDPNKPEEIRVAIDRLVTDRKWYDEITERGRANIAPYQYESIAAQYLAVYNELAARK